MKKLILLFILLICCSSPTNDDISTEFISEITYQNLNGEYINEDLTNKKTIIVFWADYWGSCRQELPVLEANLNNFNDEYDVIALAHSDINSTNSWVQNNLKNILTIGISTQEIRDKYKVIGQPITIILNEKGEIIFREYGYIPVTDF